MPKGKVMGNPVRDDFFIVNRKSSRIIMKLKDDDKLLVVSVNTAVIVRPYSVYGLPYSN